MAEPISLIASVAGLLDVSLRSSKALHSLQSQLRNAPNLIQALSNEVEDLKAVLARVEDTTKASKSSGQHVPAITATMVDLEAQLRKAKVTLSNLDTLTKNLAAEKPTLKRVKWCLKQSRASELQSELKEVRTKINKLLVAHNRQIRSGNLTGVRRILQNNRAALLDVDRSGRTVLLAALRGRYPWEKVLQTINLLLQAGADPDQEDDYGNTMRIEVARRIVKWPDKYRSAQLQDICSMSKSAGILELTFLHKIIVGQCHVDLATTLESRSPDILAQIDEPDIVGETPLMYAARLGHVDQVKALVDAGADVNVKRKNGSSALSIAANAEIVDLLIRAGADVHATDRKDTTALHLATGKDKAEIVEKLLSMGAMVNLQTLYGGFTPLRMAAQYNSADAARLLCSLGGDIEAKDNWGRSPLDFAIQFNSYDTIVVLLELGADYLSQDHGKFFLSRTAKYGDEVTLRILASFEPEGIDINAIVNRRGQTAYEIFKRRSDITENIRSAFYSFIKVLIRNQSGGKMSESESDSDDESFVDAVEFPEQDSHV
ncbi:hypothetical protein CEP53_010521 [Fusarium sp. AF-6]|nr:hypothetical protein CEP53_010521 [Fusarium sp. AF-6]